MVLAQVTVDAGEPFERRRHGGRTGLRDGACHHGLDRFRRRRLGVTCLGDSAQELHPLLGRRGPADDMQPRGDERAFDLVERGGQPFDDRVRRLPGLRMVRREVEHLGLRMVGREVERLGLWIVRREVGRFGLRMVGREVERLGLREHQLAQTAPLFRRARRE